MSRGPSGGGAVLPWVAVALGPGAAFLHEAGLMSVGPAATFWPIAFVVLAGSLGRAVGVARLMGGGPRWQGLVVAIPNAAVVAVYGFLLVFFGLGGSR